MGRKPIQYDTEKIVTMLADGYLVSEIAKELKLNIRTLEAKLVRLRDKCGAKNNTHLSCNYLRKGLIK